MVATSKNPLGETKILSLSLSKEKLTLIFLFHFTWLMMMWKITKLRTSSHWMDNPKAGRVSSENLQESLGKKCNTLLCCLPKTLQWLSQKGKKLFREKNDLEWFLDEYLLVPLDYVVPFFYSFFPVFMDNESRHLWATASMSSMGALKYIAHLLLLLRLLHFIINVRNKCVTLVQVVIDMEWRSYVIFDSSAHIIYTYILTYILSIQTELYIYF